MTEELNEPDWEVTVTVPLRLPAEQRESLFNAVADAVTAWEPDNRTDWDAIVSAHPETFSLLLWLHAEAVWKLSRFDEPMAAIVDYGVNRIDEMLATVDLSDVSDAGSAVERVAETLKAAAEWRVSRQAWAEEAMRLQSELDADSAPATWDLHHEYRDEGSGDPEFHGACRTCGSEYDDERHDEPFGPQPPEPEPNAPCSCPPDGAVFPAPWSRPQCAVHPTSETEDRQWVRPVPECSMQNHAHSPHEVLLPDLSTIPCPGQGMYPSPSGAVHPDGDTA